MSSQVQFRRGTTTQNNAFTGAQGEITYDTDIKTLRLHDGSTAGGGATVVTLAATQSLTNKTLSTGSVWSGNAVGLTYGGTGSSLTAAAGAIAYSTSSGLALNSAGTSGQLLQSAGSGTPIWVNASSLTTGTATNATNAANITGGSAGYLVYQSDTSTTSFISPGTTGYLLKSTGASTAPTWVTPNITVGTTAVSVGNTETSFAGVTSITMSNGSYGGATVGSITGSGPWTATLTGISSTTGISVGQNITATAGTGTLFGGTPTSVLVASIVSGTSITYTVTGGTTPTAGTVTSLTTFGFLQVPSGTTAQRPYVPAVGMIRYNSTQSSFEGYASGAWSSLGGVKAVNGFTYILAETAAGAANGDLDFYAQNAGVTAAVQIGQWNRTNLKDYTGTLVGTQTTQNVFNATATTVNAFGAATTVSIGASTGTLTINNASTVITGNLTVNGTTTTISATTVTVADKNIELGTTGSPTDTTANGGGITLRGATDKTIIYDNTNNNWTSSENWNIPTGKVFKINNVSMLSATALGTTVVGSSLTSVGTIGTGVWQGTIVGPTYGGTGVNNGSNTITLGGNLTTSGAYTTTLTTTANTSVTLPTTGTLATLAGSETLTNKTLSTGSTWNGNIVGGTYGGTGVNNGANTITIAGSVTHAGAFTQSFTATANTAVTLPTTGTLATLAGTETLTNKTISAGILTGTLTAAGGVGTNGQYLQSTGTGVQWATLSGTISLTGTSGTGSVSTGGTLTFASGNGITASVSSSTVTINSPQDVQTTASPTFAGATATTNGFTAGTNGPFFLNHNVIAANFTVPSNYNAMTAGPVTINSGITVTVTSGSTWTVV